MSGEIVNIAGYRFVSLDDLARRREALKPRCEELGLKGTILLSPEGINLFLAGSRESIDQFLDEFRAQKKFADLAVKESLSDRQPFRRMNVRLKREIIAFGVDGVDPSRNTAPRISPAQLKQWLDEARPLTMLDTRNRYEVELGSFKDAVDLKIDSFRSFPVAAESLPESVRSEPLVMYCTGGIRCEKAAALLVERGFTEVYQLDGGILNSFEQCGGEHWQGECFVFDHRVALDSDLHETPTTICFACQALLSEQDQQTDEYVVGESCPYCAAAQRAGAE